MSDAKKPLICLYVPFARRDAFRLVGRTALQAVRNAARRAYDAAAWRLAGRLDAHYSSWEDRSNSNVGDAAIPAGLRAVLSDGAPELNFLEVSWGTLTPELVETINREAAFVLVAGGYFVVRPDRSLSPRSREDLPLLRRLRRPLIPCGVGVNFTLDERGERPLPDEPSRNALREWFGLCSSIGVRDQASVEMVRSLGMQAHLMPDPVLAIEPKGKSRAVGGRSGPSIGLNLAFHGHRSPRLVKQTLGAIRDAAHILQKECDAELVYFIHSSSEQFPLRMLRSSGLEIRCVGGDIDDMLPHYAGLDVHLAQMMHSSIMSVCAGTPVGVVAYDAKNIEFCRLAGLSDFVVPEAEVAPEVVVDLAERLLGDRAQVVDGITGARESLRRRQREFIDAACRPLLE